MTNIAAALWQQADRHPSRVAIRAGDDTRSYAEVRGRAARVAGALGRLGIGPGERVLLVGPNVPEFVAALRGTQAAGGIAVTVNPMSTAAELEYVLADAGCAAAIAWPSTSTAAERACAAEQTRLLIFDAELGFAADGASPATPLPRGEDDPALILYTSGTTGRPKGAQITHGNLCACAGIFERELRLEQSDTFATALPLFHIFGQGVVLGATLQAGATLSLLERFDPEQFIARMARDRVTVAAGVPTMWNALLHVAEGADPAAFASLRLAASGGASLPEEVLRAFSDRFGCTILEGYGLTETTGAATFNGLGRPRKPGRVGVALPGCEIRIVDFDGSPLAAGEVGEVLVRGPVVMQGYWRREQATAEVLRGGWLHTGDLGERDVDGDLRIVDRKKDLIIRGGYNVYPREVEEVLFEHPEIVEVAVVGIPDAHYGEEVAAAIVLRPGSTLAMGELRAWAKERLSAYKVPHRLLVVDALPKGPTGKILRREIDRERLAAATIADPPKALR